MFREDWLKIYNPKLENNKEALKSFPVVPFLLLHNAMQCLSDVIRITDIQKFPRQRIVQSQLVNSKNILRNPRAWLKGNCTPNSGQLVGIVVRRTKLRKIQTSLRLDLGIRSTLESSSAVTISTLESPFVSTPNTTDHSLLPHTPVSPIISDPPGHHGEALRGHPPPLLPECPGPVPV